MWIMFFSLLCCCGWLGPSITCELVISLSLFFFALISSFSLFCCIGSVFAKHNISTVERLLGACVLSLSNTLPHTHVSGIAPLRLWTPHLSGKRIGRSNVCVYTAGWGIASPHWLPVSDWGLHRTPWCAAPGRKTFFWKLFVLEKTSAPSKNDVLHLIIHILMGFSLPCFHFQKIRSLVYTILAAEVECISWFCFVFLFSPFYPLNLFFPTIRFLCFSLTRGFERGFENVSLCFCLDFNY